MFNAGGRISLKIGSPDVRSYSMSPCWQQGGGSWPVCRDPPAGGLIHFVLHALCGVRGTPSTSNFNTCLIHFNTCDRRDHPLKPTVPLFLHQLILLGRMDLSPAPDWLRTLSSVMSYLDCSLNPLIYCSHEDFREAGLALLWTRRKLLSSDPVLTAITPLDMWQIPSDIPRSIPISSIVSFFGQLTDAKPDLRPKGFQI